MRSVCLLCLVIGVAACGGNNETITVNLDPVDASAANSVDISNDTGDVLVEGEAGRTTVDVEVTFTGGSQADFDQVTATSVLSGATVDVVLDVPSNLPNVVASIKVLVPEGFSVDVAGAAGLGTVGNVEVKGVTGGANLLSDSGDVVCQDVTGGMQIVTNSGNVTIDTDLNQGDSIEVDIDFLGEIELTLPSATVADLNAVTGGGSVAIGAAFNFSGTNTDGVAQGTFNGGDAQTSIDLFTESGEITLLAQ